MAINIFYYSPLQNNYHFALPRTIKCFGFRDILVFSQGPLVTKGLTGDIIVFSSFSSIVKWSNYSLNKKKIKLSHMGVMLLVFLNTIKWQVYPLNKKINHASEALLVFSLKFFCYWKKKKVLVYGKRLHISYVVSLNGKKNTVFLNALLHFKNTVYGRCLHI